MRSIKRVAQKGFTLIELMITIAIVGILAAIAIPSYLSYTESARFTEVINSVSTYKTSVAACIQRTGGLGTCDNGASGIPAAQGAAGNVASVTVTNGVITGTSQNLSTNYTYILTPTDNNGFITWAVSGTCLAAGVCG